MDHRAFLKSLSVAQKNALTSRSDSAGLLHLAGHVGLILLLGLLIGFGVPFWWLLIVPQGIAIAFLFTLQHECTHKTPFRSDWLNEWAGQATGFLIVQPFLWFRYFHFAHHRFTNLPEGDPELAGLPKPDSWPSFWLHLSTVTYWRDKIVLLWTNAVGDPSADYLPVNAIPRIRREARLMIAGYALVLLFTLAVSPVLFWVWILPLMTGFPVLRLYLLAEHGRCPTVANMFENTRTTFTNRIVRFLAWNMPYHCEHHTYPQVPFFRLAELHVILRDRLRVTSDGYREFTSDYVSRF